MRLRKVNSRLEPKTFNILDKERRDKVCEEMISVDQGINECIIMGDGTWIYAYDQFK